VNEKLDELLDRELGTVESLFPADFQGWVRDMVDRLRRHGMEELFHYLDSPACEKEVRQFLKQKGDELLARDLQRFLSPDQYDALRIHVRKGIRDFLRSAEVGSTLATFLDDKLEKIFNSTGTTRELLPASIVEELTGQLEREIAAAAGRVLQDASFRELLDQKMKEALKAALGSLQGVSGFLAKMLDPNWVLSLFPEFVNKMEQEIAAWLREDATRRHIAHALAQSIDLFLDRPLATWLEAIPYNKTAALRRLTRKKALKLVCSPQTVELLLSIVELNVERVRERSLGSILTENLTEKGVEEVREAAADEVIATVRSQASREMLERNVTEKIDEWLSQRPIGRLSALIPANARDELADMIYKQLAELLVNDLQRWSPKIGQCVKVDSRNLLKEDYHHEQYQTQTFFRRV
jgi:uncharacterized membrane-anchored protein YjiN (DUF445 family)